MEVSLLQHLSTVLNVRQKDKHITQRNYRLSESRGEQNDEYHEDMEGQVHEDRARLDDAEVLRVVLDLPLLLLEEVIRPDSIVL